ncbi:MAG: tRNA pseudouridine(38-40) synthase TruA [Tissierellia bacterium]|nr:tRNA pseudouridine(38-40) synthase TruA [Tissierellia bacterium]
MKNIKIIIQYDGSAYSGWQIQDNAVTIQQKIVEAIKAVTGEDVNLIGSGRTDKGVHAYGQVANFRTSTNIRPDKIHYWLKMHLPNDIKIVDSREVEYDFHARFDAKSKRYIYKIYNGEDLHPIYRNIYEEINYSIDIDKMISAAPLLIGEHDFSGFSAVLEENTNPIRTVDEISINKRGKLIEIEIEAMSFLRNQVRIIAGTLVEIGRGKMPAENIIEIFNTGDRNLAGPTLGGRGLYLMEVRY